MAGQHWQHWPTLANVWQHWQHWPTRPTLANVCGQHWQAVKTHVHFLLIFAIFSLNLSFFKDYRRILLIKSYIAAFKINVGRTLAMLVEYLQFC